MIEMRNLFNALNAENLNSEERYAQYEMPEILFGLNDTVICRALYALPS
jgi:hypothetical protein